MDGYGAYTGQPYPQVPPGQPEYAAPMQRPPSQTNAQTPHPTGNNSSFSFISLSIT